MDDDLRDLVELGAELISQKLFFLVAVGRGVKTSIASSAILPYGLVEPLAMGVSRSTATRNRQ